MLSTLCRYLNLILKSGIEAFLLQLVQDKPKLKKVIKKINPDIQANLWDKNPDIDAINRMTLKKKISFLKILDIFPL